MFSFQKLRISLLVLLSIPAFLSAQNSFDYPIDYQLLEPSDFEETTESQIQYYINRYEKAQVALIEIEQQIQSSFESLSAPKEEYHPHKKEKKKERKKREKRELREAKQKLRKAKIATARLDYIQLKLDTISFLKEIWMEQITTSSSKQFAMTESFLQQVHPDSCYQISINDKTHSLEDFDLVPIASYQGATSNWTENIPFRAVHATKDTITRTPAATKWVQRPGDRNCLSEDPNDCLVWCLVEVGGQAEVLDLIHLAQCPDFYEQNKTACSRNIQVLKEFKNEVPYVLLDKTSKDLVAITAWSTCK